MSNSLQPRQPQTHNITPHTPLPLDENPASVYLNSLTSELSQYTMSNALRTIISIMLKEDVESIDEQQMLNFAWGNLRYQHTAALRARLAQKYAPANANRILSALRGVLKEAWRLGYMTAEEYQRAVDIKNVRANSLPAGRDLEAHEIQQLVNLCRSEGTPAGVRDAAIIALLYTCGLRRSELVELRVEDFDPKTGQLRVRKGKGRKQRTVYVVGGAHKALMRWLALLGEESGPLFEPIRKNGHIQDGGMVSQSVYDMLKRRAKQAGIEDFSPHDFRRTFVGDMLDNGVDIATVANIAGHSSVDTTRRYDRRPETTKRDAAEKLHFPPDGDDG
jgi:integrase